MAEVNVDDLSLPEDVLAKLAELDLELSEGWSTFTQKVFYRMQFILFMMRTPPTQCIMDNLGLV